MFCGLEKILLDSELAKPLSPYKHRARLSYSPLRPDSLDSLHRIGLEGEGRMFSLEGGLVGMAEVHGEGHLGGLARRRGAYVEVLDEGLAICLEVGIVLGRKLGCGRTDQRGSRSVRAGVLLW